MEIRTGKEIKKEILKEAIYIKSLIEEKKKIEKSLKTIKDEGVSNSTSLRNKKSMPKRLKDKYRIKENETPLEETSGIGKNLTIKHSAGHIDESKLRKAIKKQLWEAYAANIEEGSNDVEIMSTEEYFPISIPSANKSDYDLFKDVVNQGIDSHLEGFVKSKFGKKDTSLGTRFVFNFHLSEMPILLRRLEEMADNGNESAGEWLNDIKDSLENED
jgi:hypothetical protein